MLANRWVQEFSHQPHGNEYSFNFLLQPTTRIIKLVQIGTEDRHCILSALTGGVHLGQKPPCKQL